MTKEVMSSLRERLPKGSARNKIEFLADAMDTTATEIHEFLAALKPAAVNLLANSQFNENMELESNYRQLISQAGTAADLTRTISNGRCSMMVAPDWAVEVPTDKDSVSGFKVEGLSDSYYEEYPTIDKDSGVLSYFSSAFTLYQVVSVPFNGKHHQALKGRFSLSGVAGQTVTIGIARLWHDYHGKLVISQPMGEKTYTLTENDPWLPVTVETEAVSCQRYGNAGTLALYIRVEGAQFGRIYNAKLWHSDKYGNAPEQFANQHHGDAYRRAFGWRNQVSSNAEIVAPNVVKFHFKRHLPYVFNPEQHLIVESRMKPSAQVTTIDSNSVTLTFSEDDFNSQTNQLGEFMGMIGMQYSAMPVGLGFY
ncbi:hypothetical protein MD588_18935 [Photobacterium sp. SDRW27]|uniref:hypothetical protein n=1 Tax=Photobacterium obscurum TaxID=2829490 RepID=UPI002243E85F|nr:hypothetical protein [Photobacterium obscurum]MCW8330872.1 hypothetical protein [Photobacterium obscurum]